LLLRTGHVSAGDPFSFGRWGGYWSFPECQLGDDPAEVPVFLRKPDPRSWPGHTFSQMLVLPETRLPVSAYGSDLAASSAFLAALK